MDELMQKLQLTQCADVLIGDKLNKGLSGGQAKVCTHTVHAMCAPCTHVHMLPWQQA